MPTPFTEPKPPADSKHPVDEDSLDELPPLDGGEDEAETLAPDLDDDETPAEDDDPFDDSTAEGDTPPDLEVTGAEGGWLVDADDAETLDVGTADILGAREERGLLDDNDELGVGDEDFGLDDDGAVAAVDAGEEGPDAEDDELREEDLPGLDADEDGEGKDDSFFEPLAGEEEPARLPWSLQGWNPAGAPSALGAVHALACAARGILVAEQGLACVDLEGAVRVFPAEGLDGGEVTSLCFDGALLVAATERGGVMVSHDGGATFGQANSWRERVSAQEAASGLELALGAGELWGRTAQGKLLCSADQGASWESADVDGFVLAIAVDDKGKLVALVSTLGGAEIVRGARGALEASGLVAPEVRPGAQATIAARGVSVTFAVRGASIRRALDGQTWSSVEGTAGAAAVEFIDGTGTLLAAVFADAEDRVLLVRASGDGTARIIAAVDAEHATPENAIALVWDEAHGVAWVGGAFGLSAFQPAIDVAGESPRSRLHTGAAGKGRDD